MNVNEVYESNLLPFKRYGNKARCRCPVDIVHSDILSKLNKILQDSIECCDMLEDILRSGDAE